MAEKTEIVPLADRVLIQVRKKQQESSTLIIPEDAQKNSQVADVIAVGPGKVVDGKLVPVSVKAGDEVVFSKYAGTEVEMNDDKYLIVREEDILAVVKQ